MDKPLIVFPDQTKEMSVILFNKLTKAYKLAVTEKDKAARLKDELFLRVQNAIEGKGFDVILEVHIVEDQREVDMFIQKIFDEILP